MPESVAYLEAVVGADITSFRRAMAQVRGDITGVHTGLSQSLRNIGRDMTYALTVPLLAVGAGAIKIASDYDKVIHNIASISEDFYQDMERQSDAILRFGASTMSGPKAAAEAYYQVVSAGVTNAADAMAIMEASVATAEAGLANLEATTTGMTQAMLAFGAFTDPAFRNVSDAAQHFSNVLTRTVQLGVGSMDDFVISMGRAVSATAAAGGSYDDLGIAVSFFTQRGMTAYNAATSMTNIMNKLITPTAELTTVFRQLGVTTGQELFEKFGDMGGVMRALYSVVGDNTQRWAEMFNTIQAKRGIFTITNDMQGFLDYVDEFNKGLDTATQTARDIQLMSFEAQVRLLNSSISALAVSIGQALIPVLVPVIQKITDFFLKASQLNPAIIELIVAVGAFVAALGPLVWIIGTLLSPMGLLIGLVAGVGVAFATNFNGIATAISSAVNTAIPSLSNLTNTISSFFDMLTGQGQYGMTSWNVLGNEDGTLPAALQQIKHFSVAPGDTLWGLQGTTGLSVEQMMQAAGITDPRALRPGNYTYTGSGSGSTGGEGYNPQLLHPPTGNLSNRFAAAWAVFGDKLKEAITATLSEVSNWIKTDGAVLLGNLVGQIAIGIIDAVEAVFGLATGQVPGAVDFVSEFSKSFSAGFQQALDNANIEESSFKGFASKIIALLISAIVGFQFANMATFGLAGFGLKFISFIIQGAFGSSAVVGSASSGGLSALIGKFIGNVLKVVLGGVTGAMILGAVTGVAIYDKMAVEVRDGIAKAILDAIGVSFTGINDQDAELQVWRNNAQTGIANGLAGIFDAVGRTDIGDSLRALAAESAATNTAIYASEYRNEVANLVLGGGSVNSPWYVIPELDAQNYFNPNALAGQGPSYGLDAMPFPTASPITSGQQNFNRFIQRVADGLSPVVSSLRQGFLLALDRAKAQLRTDLESPQYNWIANPLSMLDVNGNYIGEDKAAGKLGGTRRGPLSALSTSIEEGMTEVKDKFTTGFTDIGTQIDTSTLDVGAKLLAFSAGVLAAVPSVLTAFGALAISVGIGMNALLLVVTTYANLIIAKWNEMLMTLGAAPTMMGYSPDAYAGAGGVVTNTTNVYVTTDKPARLNDSLLKAGTSVYEGASGVRKVTR